MRPGAVTAFGLEFCRVEPRHVPDKAALIAVYNATDGANWKTETNWLTTKPIDQWHGVITDRNGRVVELNLSLNNLTGKIPAKIGELNRLRTLDLFSNSVAGAIPPELGNLTQLTKLQLSRNNFAGEIPHEIGMLRNLKEFEVAQNNLTGEIPNTLWRLQKLQTLTLRRNDLTGHISPEIGNLRALVRLDFYDNGLTGPIPPEFGRLTNLERLSLIGNQLSGTIPPQLGQMRRLIYLNVAGNRISGSIPAELAQIATLERLAASNNQLEGIIPPEIGDLTELRALSLSRNMLAGPIPASLGNLKELVFFSMSENNLSGDIPASLGKLRNLDTFNIRNNELLTGCIPAYLASVPFTDFSDVDLPFCATTEVVPTPVSLVTHYATISTNKGSFVVELLDDIADVYVSNFLKLFRSDFYNGSEWHRVVDGFVIQTGINAEGKTADRFDDEFHPDMKHDAAGIVSMANAGLNTNTSQFFITLAAAPHLDPYVDGEPKHCENPEVSCHAVFGKVIKGMNVVFAIEQGDIIESIDVTGGIEIPVR